MPILCGEAASANDSCGGAHSSAVSPAPTKMGDGPLSQCALSQVLILRPPKTAKPHFS